MIAVCLTGYIQNGNTLEKKMAYIKYLLINPASIKDKFPTMYYVLACCLAFIVGISTVQFPRTSPIGIFQTNI